MAVPPPGDAGSGGDVAADEMTLDERAAARAFVARCEVRLSTLHRIAVGMLSGAGLLVVFPVVARDSVSGILRSLVISDFDVVDAVLIVAMLAVLAVPVVALWLLFGDLTRFYFHANHVGDAASTVFTPRFTLTALRLPSDELGSATASRLDAARHDPRVVELLVPTNDVTRGRIDRQLAVYDGLPTGSDDLTRAAGLFELAASNERRLLDEVAKIEYGMARHVLRLRSLVLRYVKALLALLTTAVAVYAGDAVVAGLDAGDDLGLGEHIWLAAVILGWGPLVLLAVTTPVTWIEHLMRDDGAGSTAVGADPELTHIERVSLRIAAIGWIAAATSMAILAFDDAATATTRSWGLGVLAVSAIAIAWAASSGRCACLARRG